MKDLILFRHAKSSWTDPLMSDFDRPLNERGCQAAPLMAAHMAKQLPLPDVILCSSAQRTRETLSALLTTYAHEMKIELRRDLYLAGEYAILDYIKRVEEADCVMVLGHNPGLEICAQMLCVEGDIQNMETKFPTAACAHIRFDVESWRDITTQSGQLVNFVRPRDLE